VIIDAISGVVVSQEHVRNDIMRGCQRGDKGVVDSYNHWLTLIPEESKMIVQSIQLSLQEEAKMLHERDSSKTNPYLVRQVPEVKPKDPSETIKCYFTALVAQGKNPTAAAAEAIARFAAEQSDGKSFTSLEMSPFDSMHWEMVTSLGAVVVPNFKWNEDCRYFSDGSNDTLLTPQLTSIRWLISTLTGNIIGVQSQYNTSAKGACHCLLPEKREDEWVEFAIDNNYESTIIEGFVKDTGILLQAPQSKEKEPALKEGSFTPFILRLSPGGVLSGLHGVIAPTGIVALGLISKKSNSSSNDTSILGLRYTMLLFPILCLLIVILVWLRPTLWVAFGGMIMLKAFSYALNNPTTKELLYQPTSQAVKYKAKSWIDTFGGRGSKALGSLVTNAFSDSATHLVANGSSVGLMAAIFMIFNAWYVGRAFDDYLP